MPATALAIKSDLTENLTGLQKAAVLCMVLGRSYTGRLFDHLTPEEISSVSYEIARLERVSTEVTEMVLLEWLETARAAESFALGGVDYAKEILEQAFGSQKAAFMLKRLQAQLNENAGLSRLRKVDPQQLGAMLRNEHPQTIGLILAHLEPAQTAQVLKELGAEVGKTVIYRMASLDKVSPEMLELIERALGPETELSLNQGMSMAGGPQSVAAVLNLIAPSLEKELLDGLNAEDTDLCEQVKNLMFVFEDMIALDVKAIQRVLKEVDSKELALALKIASAELKAHILGAMSKRAVEALEEELDFMGPVRLREVETAQVSIVAKVRQLDEAGEIVISSGGDDEIVP